MSVRRDNGKILNLIQYSQAILLLCITSLHLPPLIPSLLLSQTGLSLLSLILHKQHKSSEEEQACGGKWKGQMKFSERDDCRDPEATLPNARGEPQPRGHIHPLGGGNWSLSLLRNPFRLHLLPRCFEKHHLKLKGVWTQAVVYGMTKGVAKRELVIFTSGPQSFRGAWAICLFSPVCVNRNTQRISGCVSSVVGGTTG